MKRRDFLNLMAGLPFGNILFNERALAEEDMPKPSRNRFLLYVHMGSACGIGSGLVQPIRAGQWPKGYFDPGNGGQGVNPLLSRQTEAANGMVLHDYIKFLAPISQNMCLVNGNSQSLDHNVASIIQRRGLPIAAAAPEWPMAVAQFMRTDSRRNPIVISSGVKTASVPDITTVQSKNIDDFTRITRDIDEIPRDAASPFLDILKKRFSAPKFDTVVSDKNLQSLADYQLTTLQNGLKELNGAQGDIQNLRDALNNDAVKNHVKDCMEADEIAKMATDPIRDSLVLAGILAKTGLANGFHLNVAGEDHHQGAADVWTPRNMGGVWALISLFYRWIQAQNLQDDMLVVVSHDFSRTPYNGKIIEVDTKGLDGSMQRLKVPGRDHSLAMGMMFINPAVPKGGRVGGIADNMVPVPSSDARGTFDPNNPAYNSYDIVGSMLMRVFPELFPTERMVRKHWPSFKEIAPILS